MSPGSAVATLNVTNQDATIPLGNVLINLTATTRDCTLTLPAESGDVGSQVTVKLSTGSTHNGSIQPHSGDTIDLAGAAIVVPPTNPVWMGIGN